VYGGVSVADSTNIAFEMSHINGIKANLMKAEESKPLILLKHGETHNGDPKPHVGLC
jgi:hypothetical protein